MTRAKSQGVRIKRDPELDGPVRKNLELRYANRILWRTSYKEKVAKGQDSWFAFKVELKSLIENISGSCLRKMSAEIFEADQGSRAALCI
ncbi:hypothetical protein STEG23_014125 [Scotinomys teguina]